MALSNLQKNLHLLWRAGFGPSLADMPVLSTKTPTQMWQKMVQDSQETPEKITASAPRTNKAFLNALPDDTTRNATLAALRMADKKELEQLNARWITALIHSQAQLRERMAFFWHGHFATRVTRTDFNRELMHLFRQNALGNFGDLLLQVSKSPAMLAFLNNQQNRKQNPNENFAREVMELFTLGRGNYTEKDVKEAARAFTGWSYSVAPAPADSPQSGEAYFAFRNSYHDDGEKTVLGETGAFKGEDVIRILLKQQQTARFLTTKIYRYFVNEKPDEKRIKALSKTFYDANYDIPTLLTAIFTAPWFFEEANVGNRIKSPIELLVGMLRVLPVEMGNPRGYYILQGAMGQTLLLPPNVAGWPSGNAWIDSSSLLLRMELPVILAGTEDLESAPKQDDDIQMGKMTPEAKANTKGAFAPGLLQSHVKWEEADKVIRGMTEAQIASLLLLQPEKAPVSAAKAAATSGATSLNNRQYVLRLMSLPEYQLC